MNGAFVNLLIRVFGSCLHALLLDVYFGVEVPAQRAVFACSAQGDTTKQLSKVFALVTLPPEMYECSCCFTSLPILADVNLFHFSHSSGFLTAFICISLMTLCLTACRISSFVRCLFKPLAYFSWIVFFLLVRRYSLYILDTSSLSDLCTINIFSPSTAFLFTLSGVFQRVDQFIFSFKSEDVGICIRLELEGTLEITCASGSGALVH